MKYMYICIYIRGLTAVCLKSISRFGYEIHFANEITVKDMCKINHANRNKV